MYVPLLTEPRIAWLSASEPLATNNISSGVQPSIVATLTLAVATADLQTRPNTCALEGLP